MRGNALAGEGPLGGKRMRGGYRGGARREGGREMLGGTHGCRELENPCEFAIWCVFSAWPEGVMMGRIWLTKYDFNGCRGSLDGVFDRLTPNTHRDYS